MEGQTLREDPHSFLVALPSPSDQVFTTSRLNWRIGDALATGFVLSPIRKLHYELPSRQPSASAPLITGSRCRVINPKPTARLCQHVFSLSQHGNTTCPLTGPAAASLPGKGRPTGPGLRLSPQPPLPALLPGQRHGLYTPQKPRLVI